MGHIMATKTTKSATTPRKSSYTKTTAAKPAASESSEVKTSVSETSATPEVAPVPTPVSAPSPSAAPTPVVVTETTPVVGEADLKKRELIDLVVERSGIKKKDAKPVIEAMLAVLGETISSGRELNLQPLGKLRINRATERGNGRVIVCKLRQSLSRPGGPKDPLAEAAE